MNYLRKRNYNKIELAEKERMNPFLWGGGINGVFIPLIKISVCTKFTIDESYQAYRRLRYLQT